MNEQEYLEQRVKDQIDWYDKKSIWHKKWLMRLKITETIFALLIPFLVAYISQETFVLKICVGFFGIIVAAIANLITLYKLQENWILYRTVAESLKHEKYLFITKSGPYKDDTHFHAFVERFESYLSKENNQWASYNTDQDDSKK